MTVQSRPSLPPPHRSSQGFRSLPLRSLLLLSGAVALLLGVGAGLGLPWLLRQRPQAQLAQLPPVENLLGQDETSLRAIANQPKGASPGRDRDRARFLLAARGLETGPGQSLALLKDLEKSYTPLAGHILALRAQAQQRQGDRAAATKTWQTLLRQHPKEPVAAEALYALSQDASSGTEARRYRDEALQTLPAHPRSVELALQRLKTDPKDLEAMRVIARYGHHTPELADVLVTLIDHHASQLTPADWEAIAFAYWEKLDFKGAATAYAKAPATARNLYRSARSLQLSERTSQAKSIYATVVKTFPKTPEAGLALQRLAETTAPSRALFYWDQLMKHYPDRAAPALLAQATMLDQQAKTEPAAQLRQRLLSQYKNSDAAAELRWQLAQRYANAQDYPKAIQFAQGIVQDSPGSPLAPKAGFWLGRWYQQLSQSGPASQSFERVLQRYPQSYYAWRSASVLGLPVGDFLSVQKLQPAMVPHPERSPLPAGSETLQELYLTGQDAAAWAQWQVEFSNRQDPSVAEQFTDGFMRLGVGDHLDAIFMIASLANRDSEADQAQVKALKRRRDFWYGLYPLPYFQDIQQAALNAKLNPLLVTALIRQESRFMPGIESVVGAKGLMQVMPETAEWVAPNVNLKTFKLNDPLDNLKLGTWYLNYTHDEWDGNSMLAVASYNAGPGAVGDWVRRFEGLDVDRFIEKIPYPETKGYVSSIFENYWNYMRLYNPEISALLARYSPDHAALREAGSTAESSPP